jgi:phenylacetate-CoA ligase
MFSETKGLSGFLLKRKIKRMSLADNILDHVQLISKWEPDVLVGPPSYYRSLIESAEKAGEHLDVKIALACGEMIGSSTRKLIADGLNAEVFQAYGVSEAGGIAWECSNHSGYHLNADSSIVEFLRDGEQVSAGEPGEVCVTNLWRKPTPIIRYRVGDIATHVDDECSCGRGLPLIKDIQGRIVDFILAKDGNCISPFRVMFMLEDIAGVAQYKVVQKSDSSIDVFVRAEQTVAVEPLAEALRQCCRELFGDMPLNVRLVDKIENPAGQKFRVVESQLTR